MSSSDSVFLFEIVVEELKSFIDCKEFYIQSQFADVFIVNLRDPNDLDTLVPKSKPKKKTKVRRKLLEKQPEKILSGRSILFTSKIDTLITNMKNFPLELSLYDRDDPDNKLGSTHIPWSPLYIDYLHKLRSKPDFSPIFVSGGYNVYDDLTSKRMATIRLNIKLSHLKDKLTTSFRSLSEDNQNTVMYTEFNSKPMHILSTIKEPPFDIAQETGIIKTIYSGGKRKNISNKSKNTRKKSKEHISQKKEFRKIEEKSSEHAKEEKENVEEPKNTQESSRITLVRSDTELDKNRHIEIIKTKSCSSIKGDQFNILNYIFGDINSPLGNQVYYVGYFTVENEFNKSRGSSSPLSSKSQSPGKADTSSGQVTPKETYKFRICDKECPSKRDDNICNQSMCSMNLPAEAAHLISVTKCREIECQNKKNTEPTPPPDERILLQLTNKECCKHAKPVTKKVDKLDEKTNAFLKDIFKAKEGKTEAVEEVVGAVKAQMKFGEHECFCSCECTFGLVRKTTYCGICGGYEYVGEDNNVASSKLPSAPFPCPIYHKLEKNKLKSTLSTSGSEGKKKGDDGRRKSVPSTKSPKNNESGEDEDKKEKTKKKDDRFKFNYGYTAPKIGHIYCSAPCTGTLGNVPKNMGWLWTAEDVPGLKEISRGWRPGAISKRLLSMLKKAKSRQSQEQKTKPTKRAKKRVEDKPTLVICKRKGEYIIEMQVDPNEDCNDCSPLIYKIASANHEDKIKARARKERRLIRQAVKEVWSDPYHPEVCERTCLRAYKQAVGLLPYDPNNPECTCPYPEEEVETGSNSCSCDDEDVSSGCSSLDVDWEIHFSPPITCKKN